MQMRIEGRHVKITEAMQVHVHRKIDHLDKYFDGITNVHVILSVEDTRQKSQVAELVCSVARGQPLVSKAAHTDLYLAVDEAVHKMRELLKKYKSRKRTRKRVSARFASPKLGGPSYPREDEGESE